MRTVGKRVLWVAAFACAVSAGTAVAEGPLHTPLRVWAIGLPNGYVIMEYQARVLHVSAEDVAKGMVEVRGGSRLLVTLNSPAGYAVDFRARGNWIGAARIGGIGGTVEIDSRGGTIVQREAAAGRHVVAIDYRFVLAPDAVPGTYAWPLEMAIRAPAAPVHARPDAAHRLDQSLYRAKNEGRDRVVAACAEDLQGA